ncbi:hypothetical protein B0H14DRAFT_3784803 [Mycena olivaceomarginata]|nr:hypothetical protein B0H14DRAFT_3784803 [Mycena olivaceomarginata]
MSHGIAYTCPDCARNFGTTGGLTRHRNAIHRQFTPASEGEDDNTFQFQYHPDLNALPCDVDGEYLPPFSIPPPPPQPPANGQDPAAWAPFGSREEFDFANFHFVKLQSSAADINTALDLWAASIMRYGGTVPWRNSDELYATIDEIQSGHMPWKTYQMRYTGPLPAGTPPKWMTQIYEVCTRDLRAVLHHQLATTSFKDDVDMIPYRQYNHARKRVWSNLMSGDWAWKQADILAEDPNNLGCAFVAVVAGSDKTIVSVATGHQEYHPFYASPGILTGPARRAHGSAVLPVAFLVIPKTSKKHRTKPAYQKFCRQMYHASLALIYQPLKPFMETPEVVRCPDGHFRRVIYGIGPYIADYPEQVWLAAVVQNWCPKCEAHPDDLDADGARLRTRSKTEALIMCFDPGILWEDYSVRADIVPFTNDFPRADIHELLSCDLLHQVIKGTFKDHIVSWVNEYLHNAHGEKRALEIIQDIDRRISAVPEFPGLRRFPDGRDFTQWTGDDSKALMKIYIAAVAGYLPSDMTKTPSTASTSTRKIFITCGVRVDISLPRQHSLKHYPRFIRFFGSPNGLCSSITESKHIKAMLRTLVRLDKLAALKAVLTLRGMMTGTTSSYTRQVLAGEQPQVIAAESTAPLDDEDNDDGVVHGPKSLSDIQLAPTPQRGYPKTIQGLARHIQQPQLPDLLRRFLHEELNGPPDDGAAPVPIAACPVFGGQITVHHSAVARFYAPSDLGGAGGMYRERIRSNPNWHGYPRRDTVLVDVGAPLMRGIVIGRLERYRGVPTVAIVPMDSIARGAHLIGVYGTAALPEDFHFSDSLDAFNTYFVNPYADHHMHEFLT